MEVTYFSSAITQRPSVLIVMQPQLADARSERVQAPHKVLLVDDVAEVLRAYRRTLKNAGYHVLGASSADEALALLKREAFDAVVSDIVMPGASGVELLQMIRKLDADVPVILLTGHPSIDTAIPAVEHGALSYLVKPVRPAELRSKVEWAIHLHELTRMKNEALTLVERQRTPDEHELGAQLDSALASIVMAYQPIISWSKRTVHGYEALVRSTEPALPHPGALFGAAERLGRVQDLSRAIRAKAPLPMLEDGTGGQLFFNLHVQDLMDDTLADPDAPLAQMADRVVLEVTERASLDEVPRVREKIAQLREIGFRIAVDDLGAGYAGLSSFALLEPDVVKLDMALVRDVDKEPTKQRLVQSMTRLCTDMGLDVVAEGVETRAEREALVSLGCDYLQGYAFARPGPPFVEVDYGA